MPQSQSQGFNRRQLLSGFAATALVSTTEAAHAAQPKASAPSTNHSATLKIADLELMELTGHYETPGGINSQPQVNPLDVYESLRPAVYQDKPGPPKRVETKAIYLRIRTGAELDGLYGPIERDAAIVVKKTCAFS